MKLESFGDLYIDELRDLYSAENQILKALPKMIEAASSPELKQAFEHHLEETEGHVERLDEIFGNLDESPSGKVCKGMEGLLEEGEELMKETQGNEALCDAGLISSAQRVEHYEIAAYGTVRTYAKLLNDDQAVDFLNQTVKEEGEADKKLTSIAESINVQAVKETEHAAGG